MCLAPTKHSMNLPRTGETHPGWALAETVERTSPSLLSHALIPCRKDQLQEWVRGLARGLGVSQKLGWGRDGAKEYQCARWPSPTLVSG